MVTGVTVGLTPAVKNGLAQTDSSSWCIYKVGVYVLCQRSKKLDGCLGRCHRGMHVCMRSKLSFHRVAVAACAADSEHLGWGVVGHLGVIAIHSEGEATRGVAVGVPLTAREAEVAGLAPPSTSDKRADEVDVSAALGGCDGVNSKRPRAECRLTMKPWGTGA